MPLQLAAALVWTLVMNGDDGRVELGPFDTLQSCQREVAWRHKMQPARYWHDALCRNSSGYSVSVPARKD
jgi:hypothetical protein